MSRYVGKLGLSTATEIAERAVSAADDMAAPGTKFALCLDEKQRFHVMAWGGRTKPLPGWVATFNRKADPDWLASEIEYEMEQRGAQRIRALTP